VHTGNPPTPLPCLRGRRKGRTSEEQSLVLDSTAAVASPGMPLSIHGIHPIHARFRHVCCHFPGALYYFSFNGFSKVRFRSVWKGCECNVLACLRSEMRWFLGLFTSIADLGGVWLFRIHGRGAAFLRLSRLGCATFLVYVLGLFSSPQGVPKVLFRARRMYRFCLA